MGRSPCCVKEHTNKGAWTKQEDELLIKYVTQHGEGCWRSLPKAAGLLRCGKSCRLRWINYLRPDLKRGNFTREEDEIIVDLHSLLGSKWSVIAARLPGRTDNEIKNHWNTHIKRRLLSRGIDPLNHRPLNPSSPADNSCPISNREPNRFNPSASPEGRQTLTVAHDPMNSNSIISFKVDVAAASSAEEHSNSSSVLSEELQQQINLELSIGLPN